MCKYIAPKCCLSPCEICNKYNISNNMKNISQFSKNILKTNTKSKFSLIYNSKSKMFSEKIKFDYEDPLNLNSLLTEEETMVKLFT